MNKRKSFLLVFAISLVVCLFSVIVFSTFAEEESYKPKMSITMSDSLVFNIYLPNSEGLLSVSLDGEDKAFSSLPIKDGYYHLRVPLDACEADKEINLSVTLDKNGEKRIGSFTFSTVKYAEKLLSSNESDVTKKLAKDILAYVNSAKVFFGEEKSGKIESILGNYESVFSPIAAENDTPALKYAAFVLGTKPSVKFYPENNYTAKDFTFTRGDKVLTFREGSDELGDYMEISTSAYAMIETISYTVKDTSFSGKYNLSAYCDFVKNEYNESDKEALIELSEKFYIYCESAAAYRKAVIISMCDHDYQSTVKEGATAKKEGIMEKSCNKCGHSYEEPIGKTLKVLAIGNSFSEDSFMHMYIVAKSAGIENVVLGNMYIGGCSLATHMKNMNGDLGEYKFWLSSDEEQGMIVEGTGRTAKYGITYTDWDYITIQQASTSSGKPDTYSDLQGIIDYINANKTSDAEILWHMTWAYQQNSTHSGFANYANNQMTMYNSIIDTVKDKVLTNSDISGVIPSGTAIQNLRTSVLGDTLTRDGYHLSKGIGRYTAAMTWVAYLTGCDVDKITATPSDYPEVAESLDYIKDAVKKAIAKPFEITESAYPAPDTPDKPETPDKLLDSTLSPLTESDRAYLTDKGFDPDRYMLLDFDVLYNSYYNSTNSTQYAVQEVAAASNGQYMKWWSTQVFSKDELIVGSVIRLDEGYKYRPEGWIDMAKNTKRPDVVYAGDGGYCITVDEEWWGSYNCRAFNVGKDPDYYSSTLFTQAEYDAYAAAPETLNFKVYIPIVKRAELTAEDREYLESQGLDPDSYKVLDFEYFVDAHYNSTTRGSKLEESSGNVKYRFVATEVFSKYDLVLGTIIRLSGTNHNYRPDGWVKYTADKYTGTRPSIVSLEKTVVDIAWWGDFIYRGINIQNKYGSETNPVTAADATALRIYVPIYHNGLSAEDVAYLKSLGLNPNDYKVLDLEFAYNSYYNSNTGFSQHVEKEGGSNYEKFLATQRFSKDELANGSVIRIKSGYKYRPEGWIDLSTLNSKSDRPANVTAETVIIDDAWWGDFTYRGFNIAKSSGKITLEESENFKIYVKIS